VIIIAPIFIIPLFSTRPAALWVPWLDPFLAWVWKGTQSGGTGRQIRRPFHPDVQFPRIHLTSVPVCRRKQNVLLTTFHLEFVQKITDNSECVDLDSAQTIFLNQSHTACFKFPADLPIHPTSSSLQHFFLNLT
jgi:hypothetical protein